ncbi:MAG TPA: nucleoside monophosphate kinase, partial [Gemmatimonadaceae bacterium]|nr:nucleoside monophosphate kinase [Gemmatimonadaceae bacterium]
QAPLLAKALDVPTLATGDVLRAAKRAGTRLGLEAKGYMDRGELVPDSVILGILAEELQQPQYAKGVILDGAVRTVPQAEGLEQMLDSLGRKLDAVLVFDIDNEEIVRRLSDRTVCENCQTPYTGRKVGDVCDKCGGTLVRRKDDDPEAIRTRLRVYDDETAPVLDWYKRNGDRVAVVNAVGAIGDITSRALDALGVATR